tara:strand:+ start:2260 stop:3009 length:750 start_codon:yes stop_codon:yes gene_type:complete
MTIKPQPVIILVEPQMGENIGMCARAMLNCGLQRLRLVNPRQSWPNKEAMATAADADLVLQELEIFETLDQALEDCHRVFATTARNRSLNVPFKPVSDAVADAKKGIGRGHQVAFLFGPEASGLDNEAIARADLLLKFPTNPEFSSLNLAQAVLLLGWEWLKAPQEPDNLTRTETPNRGQLEEFLNRLESELLGKGFFLTNDLRPHSSKTLRSIFTKARLSQSELKMMHGVLSALTKPEKDRSIGDAAE